MQTAGGGFVNGLRQVGIERIAGDVVIDNTLFSPQGDDRAAFDNRPYRTYNVLPDALMINFQTVNVTVVPDAPRRGTRPGQPVAGQFTSTNLRQLERGPCGAGPARRRSDARGARRQRLSVGDATRRVADRRRSRARDAGAGVRVWHVQDLLAAVGRHADWRPAHGARAGGCETALHARVADAVGGDPPRQQVFQQRDGASPAAHAGRGEGRAPGDGGCGRARDYGVPRVAWHRDSRSRDRERRRPVPQRAHHRAGAGRRAARSLAQPFMPSSRRRCRSRRSTARCAAASALRTWKAACA